jgi:Mg2+/Co2+ transporter CorB
MRTFIIIVFYLFIYAFSFVGANTMKLNKSRLRQLAQSGEVAADLFVLKRKRAGEGSSRRAEEVPTRPPP